MFGFGVVWIGDFWWLCGFAGLVLWCCNADFPGCLLIVGLWLWLCGLVVLFVLVGFAWGCRFSWVG